MPIPLLNHQYFKDSFFNLFIIFICILSLSTLGFLIFDFNNSESSSSSPSNNFYTFVVKSPVVSPTPSPSPSPLTSIIYSCPEYKNNSNQNDQLIIPTSESTLSSPPSKSDFSDSNSSLSPSPSTLSIVSCWYFGEWAKPSIPRPLPFIKYNCEPRLRCSDESINSYQWKWTPYGDSSFKQHLKWINSDSSKSPVPPLTFPDSESPSFPHWVTDAPKCPVDFGPFNPHEFCQLLHGRSLFIIGDSVNIILWLSVLLLLQSVSPHVLNTDLISEQHHSFTPYKICDKSNPPFPTLLYFVRNDYVLTSMTIQSDRNHGYIQYPYVHLLNETSVILLNRGPHWKDDNIYKKELNDTLHYIKRHFQQSEIFYRSSTGGHSDCGKYKLPISPRQMPDGPPKNLPYHWGEFPRQNRIAQQLMKDMDMEDHFVDVEKITRWRFDNHRINGDCLHYCQIGTPEVWVELWFNQWKLINIKRSKRNFS